MGALTVAANVLEVPVDQAVDACTLNNALNVAQLVALVWLVRWLSKRDAAS